MNRAAFVLLVLVLAQTAPSATRTSQGLDVVCSGGCSDPGLFEAPPFMAKHLSADAFVVWALGSEEFHKEYILHEECALGTPCQYTKTHIEVMNGHPVLVEGYYPVSFLGEEEEAINAALREYWRNQQ